MMFCQKMKTSAPLIPSQKWRIIPTTQQRFEQQLCVHKLSRIFNSSLCRSGKYFVLSYQTYATMPPLTAHLLLFELIRVPKIFVVSRHWPFWLSHPLEIVTVWQRCLGTLDNDTSVMTLMRALCVTTVSSPRSGKPSLSLSLSLWCWSLSNDQFMTQS